MFTKSLVTGRCDAKSFNFRNIGVADRRGEICIGLSAGSKADAVKCFSVSL